MAFDIKALKLHEMSVQDRRDLIEQIWDSLPEQVTANEVPDWNLVELKKRYEKAKADPRQGKPWREVLESLKKTCL